MYAVKSGRRYRYYVSREPGTGSNGSAMNGRAQRSRLPAREIERLVGESVTALLSDCAALTRRAREAEIPAERVPDLLHAVRAWSGAPLDLVSRVELGPEEIALRVDLSGFLGEGTTEVRHAIPARIQRRGVEMRWVVGDAQEGLGAPRPDPALIKAVVRAHRWFDDLVSGRARSLRDIANVEGVTHRYVGHLMPLAFLAPDILAAIVAGTQPIGLTAEALTKRIDLPLGWAEQRALLLTYLRERIKEVLTGASATVVVRIFGPGLEALQANAAKVRAALAEVPGVADLQVQAQALVPQVEVRFQPDRAARFGLAPGDVRRAVTTLDGWRRAVEAADSAPSGAVRSLVTVAWLIARGALDRYESRGGHARADFPARDDLHWKFHVYESTHDQDR